MKTSIVGVAAFAAALAAASAYGDSAIVGNVSGPHVKMSAGGGYDIYVFTNLDAAASVTIVSPGECDLLLVGGGGSGGNVIGGGGAGGEVRVLEGFELTAGEYAVVVGDGGHHTQGAAGYSRNVGGGKGGDSSFGDIVAAGGGGGASYSAAGEGTGGGRNGANASYPGGGGAGAGGAADGVDGGAGVICNFADVLAGIVFGAGGGAGGGDGAPNGSGGSIYAGGGGVANETAQGGDGADGTGSGGGGGGWWCDESSQGAGNGGSGLVLLKVASLDIEDDFADIFPTGEVQAYSSRVSIGWRLYSTGGGETAAASLEYGTSPGVYAKTAEIGDVADGASGMCVVDGLVADTVYYARFSAQGSAHTAIAGHSGEFTFSTVSRAEVGMVSGADEINAYGNYTAYVFTNTSSSASMTFSKSGIVDIMIVGGGGAGGTTISGGGGAGEVKILRSYRVDAGVAYPIAVGAGGLGMGTYGEWYFYPGRNGEDSSFGDIVAVGGGGGGSWAWGTESLLNFRGRDGGSGGGSCRGNYSNGYSGWQSGGASTASDGGLGNPGGASGGGEYLANRIPGGGGGAGGPGMPGDMQMVGGDGGAGIQNDFATGTMRWYAAGGGAGGGSGHAASGSGGSGIGGDGGSGENYGSGHPGVDGTGSGGGGSFFWSDGYRGYEFGGDGGSGVVVVRIESDVYDNVADIRHVSSSVNGISATFDWYLLGAGSGESATVCLEYGFTEGLYISSVVLDAAADPGAGSATLACFSEGTVYHARLTATGDGEDDIAGATGDFTFTTGDISGYSALVDIGLVIRRGASASAMAYFDESLAGADLYVAAGSSADMADGWPATALESIGVAETSRQIDFAIGAGDGFFRLLAVLGETVYASRIVSIGDATTIDESAPYFATDFTLDGSAGDAISVHGVLESAGAGDSAAVSVEYSTTPSFSVFRSVPAGNLGSGDSVDVVLYSDDTESADYICPDTTYFVRLRADAGGGASVYSPVLQVHTFGASVLESSVAVTAVEQTVFEAVADITQIGAGGSATVVFLVGPDRNSLVEVWSQQVSRPGQVAFYYTNSVFGTVYVQARVDNSCSTAEFSAASATGSVSLADTTAWYWVGQSGGNWSDSANWANSWGTPGVNVGNCPNSGNVPVYFDRAGASPRVVVDGAYTVGRLVPAAISNVVELVGSEGAQIHIYSNLGYEEQIASYGSTIVYRDISVYYEGTNPYIPSGCAMKLYNTFLTAGYLFMHGADAAFEAYDESYVQITYQYLQIAGAGCRVVVDDSTIQFSNYWNDTTIYCAGANCTLVFAGTHPQIATPHNFGIQAAGVRFVFELPAGGYTRPPILCTGSPYGAPFYYSNADCIPTIEIAADSTYKSGKSFTCTLIDSSNCNGYASDGSAGIYEGLNLVSPSSSISFSYAYQDGTATPGTGTVPNTEIPWPGGVEPLPKFLRVSYNNAGMALFIR